MSKFKFDLMKQDLNNNKDKIAEAAIDFVRRKFIANLITENKILQLGGGNWQPLSKKYSAWKNTQRIGKTMLQFDGNLLKALRNSVKNGSSKWTNCYLTIPDSLIPYANRHNSGYQNTPQRQFIGKSSRLEKETIDVIDKKMRDILQKYN